MTYTIRLLGRPALSCDGVTVPVRGRKTWALLAMLLLSNRPPSRSRLAAMLFDETADPLGALRWNLAQLRRAFGPGLVLGGDPVTVDLPADRIVDVEVLASGSWEQALDLPGLGDELLASFDFGATPAFETWIGVERSRMVALAVGHLTEAALTQLAAGDAGRAAAIARRLVELQPYDENHHQLLVRALASSGALDAARQHVSRATALFERELGVIPSPALAGSAELVAETNLNQPATGKAGVLALLEAGDAAVDAGATEAGIDCLRRAARDADRLGDPGLRITARNRLGAALIHAVRGSDTEGSATLHQAIRIAEEAGLVEMTAAAHREIGWIAVQQGRQDQALAWLERAAALAGEDRCELSHILGVRGMTLDDRGEHRLALETFAESARLATRGQDRRQLAWARSQSVRTLVQLEEYDEARGFADEALELTRAERWNAFLPFPETQQADLYIVAGELDRASEQLDHAFTLACQIGDPCWEALTSRSLATVDEALGAVDRAVARLHDARRRCGRHPDTYQWVRAQVLNTLATIGVRHHASGASQWVDQLEALATAAGLREIVVRALIHRARLGDDDARVSASMMVADLDNPALTAHVHSLA